MAGAGPFTVTVTKQGKETGAEKDGWTRSKTPQLRPAALLGAPAQVSLVLPPAGPWHATQSLKSLRATCLWP